MVKEYVAGTTATFLRTLPQGSASTEAVCLPSRYPLISCLHVVGTQNRLETLSRLRNHQIPSALGACAQFLPMGAKEMCAQQPFLPASCLNGVFEVQKVATQNKPYILDSLGRVV